jgi:hypothetical protein
MILATEGSSLNWYPRLRLTVKLSRRRGAMLALLVPQLLLLACTRQQQTRAEQLAAEAETDQFPRIVAVSPATVPFSDNKAMIEKLHVTYRIKSPESVDAAFLELDLGTVRIASRDVPILSQGEADLKVDYPVEIGPAVKLQVHCPNGDSNWLAVGSVRPPPSSAQPRIDNITPDSITAPDRMDVANGNLDALVLLNLWGAGFQPGCTVIWRVNNGEPMAADRSIVWGKQQMIAYVTRRPLSPARWSDQRYFELLLVVVGKKKTPGRLPESKEGIRAIPVAIP